VLGCAIIAVFGLLLVRWFGWQALAAMAGVVLLAVFAKPFGPARTIVVRDTGSALGSDSSGSGSSDDSSSSSSDSSFSGGGGESAGGGASGNW